VDFIVVAMVARHVLHRRHIDAIQKHRNLTPAKLNRRHTGLDLRQLEDSRFEALIPQHIPISLPLQNLQAITTLPTKDEQMRMEWSLTGHRTGQLGNPVFEKRSIHS
jgi:hypothetical protein